MADVNRWGTPPVPDPNAIPLPGMLPPPMPPPATPASAGFAAWANDQQNAQKVANSLVKPGQPILPPNAQQAGQQAAQQPTQSPQEAPAMPPQNPGAPPPMQTTPVMGGGPPQIPNSPMPNVVNQDATPQSWAAAHPDQAAHSNWRHQAGSGWRGALKDVAGLATAGLIGGVGAAKGDPTAGLRWSQQQADYDRAVPDINQQRWRAATIQPQIDQLNLQKTRAGIDQSQATADYTRQRGSIADDKNAILRAQHGLKTDPVTGDLVDDVESQAYKDRQGLTALRAAQADRDKVLAENSTNKYKPGTTQYEEWHRRQQQADARLANMGAALGLRAQGLQLRRNDQQANFYGMGPDGKPLPNAPVFQNDEGEDVVGGLKGASTAIKAQGATGTFKDLGGSIHRTQGLLDALHQSGAALNDVRVIDALSDAAAHRGTISTAIHSQLLKSGMTPEQINAVAGVASLREQLGTLRAASKGTGSEGQTQRMLDAAPSPGDTPELANRKMVELQATYDRLAPSVSRTAGGLTLKGKGSWRSPQAPDGGGQVIEYKKNAQGRYTPGGK